MLCFLHPCRHALRRAPTGIQSSGASNNGLSVGMVRGRHAARGGTRGVRRAARGGTRGLRRPARRAGHTAGSSVGCASQSAVG